MSETSLLLHCEELEQPARGVLWIVTRLIWQGANAQRTVVLATTDQQAVRNYMLLIGGPQA